MPARSRAPSRRRPGPALSIRNRSVSESIPGVVWSVFHSVTSACAELAGGPVDQQRQRDRWRARRRARPSIEAVPLPAWQAPTAHFPAQAAAIRRRRAIRPASADAGHRQRRRPVLPGSFSHSTTASRARARAELGAGGTARVSDMTRGGRSGLSWICACTVPFFPVSHQRRWAGVSDSGRAAAVGGEVADALADQADGVAALVVGAVEGDVLGEQRVGGGVVPVRQEAVDRFLGRQRLRPGGACPLPVVPRLGRARGRRGRRVKPAPAASSTRPVSGDIGA